MCWCAADILTDGAVLRSRAVASLLFHTEPRKLKVAEVLAAFEGNDKLKRVLWKDIKGVPISKLCVVYGLVKARSEWELGAYFSHGPCSSRFDLSWLAFYFSVSLSLFLVLIAYSRQLHRPTSQVSTITSSITCANPSRRRQPPHILQSALHQRSTYQRSTIRNRSG